MALENDTAARTYNEQTASSEPSMSDVAEKERLLSEITALQSDLQTLQQRVNQAQADAAKSETNNEMLQSYIESINKNLASKN
ncbi:hypothetical protein CBS14141_000590 [Malassezia furfur]|nr:hypothetical protein CBS14141_000590 [Malassezia furfur]